MGAFVVNLHYSQVTRNLRRAKTTRGSKLGQNASKLKNTAKVRTAEYELGANAVKGGTSSVTLPKQHPATHPTNANPTQDNHSNVLGELFVVVSPSD